MRLHRHTIIIFFIISLFSTKAYSFNFGIGCCCPAPNGCVICGIVPCDTSCGGKALTQMGNESTAEISKLNSTLVNRNTELQSAINAAVNFGVKTNGQLNNNMYNSATGLLHGLEGFTSAIVKEYARRTKARVNISDNRVLQVAGAYRQQLITEEKIENDKVFGLLAQPASGDIGADRATLWKKAQVNYNQLVIELKKKSDEYNTSNGGANAGFQNIGSTSKLNSLNDFEANNTKYNLWEKYGPLSDEESSALINASLLIVNPYPLSESSSNKSSSPEFASYDIKRKAHNSKAAVIQSVLLGSAIFNTQLIDLSSVSSGYAAEIIPGDKGLNSLNDFYLSEIDGRLNNSGWFLNIKQLPPAGLNRELAYIRALKSKLLNEIYIRQSKLNTINAISAASDLNSAR